MHNGGPSAFFQNKKQQVKDLHAPPPNKTPNCDDEGTPRGLGSRVLLIAGFIGLRGVLKITKQADNQSI